jgi:hypothetical protein
MKTLLTAIFSFFTALNPVFASLTLALVSLIAVFNWLNDEWVEMLNKLDAVSHVSFGGTLDLSPFGLLDTLIPLHETLDLFTAWLALLVACTAVRMVKSLIPTLAS